VRKAKTEVGERKGESWSKTDVTMERRGWIKRRTGEGEKTATRVRGGGFMREKQSGEERRVGPPLLSSREGRLPHLAGQAGRTLSSASRDWQSRPPPDMEGRGLLLAATQCREGRGDAVSAPARLGSIQSACKRASLHAFELQPPRNAQAGRAPTVNFLAG